MIAFSDIKQHKHIKIWLTLFVAFFLILYLSELVEQSMFIDGLWYAVISKNLAIGLGDFWTPQFSTTIFTEFHEHPPLILGIQALFFKLLGQELFTERIFNACQYLLFAFLLLSAWKSSLKDAPKLYMRYTLIPLLLWQTNILAYFFLPANLLDTGVALFDLMAIYLLFQAFRTPNNWSKIVLAGFLIFLAFLSKGLVALFPFAFPMLYFLVFRTQNLKVACKNTALLSGSFILFLGILLVVSPEAKNSLYKYCDIQVKASLNGTRTLYYYRESRFYIIGQLLLTLLPMILALGSLYFINLKMKWSRVDHKAKKLAVLFFLIGLSASLPIMISPRQALPYLMPSLPYFSLAFGILIVPLLDQLINNLSRSIKLNITKLTFGLLFIGLFMIANKFGTSNQRDETVINDVQLIGDYIGEEEVIASNVYNMYISGYMMRLYEISLDTSKVVQSNFLLSKKSNILQDSSYIQVALPTKEYVLYEKKHAYSQR